MSNVLAITGASGKSGRVFFELLKENSDVINTKFEGGVRLILHSNPANVKETEQFNKFEQLSGALEDCEFLNEALFGVDTLVHISGIHWSKYVVDAAKRAGVRRLIMVHTTGIYSKYKEAGEEYRNIDAHVYEVCKENGILLTILRPTMIYGCVADKNVVTFIKMVDKLPVMPVVGGARYGLQPVHYADLGQAYYDVLIREEVCANHDYILSGGEEIMLRDMLLIIASNLGKKIHFLSVPFPIAYTMALGLYGVTFGKKDFREKVKRLVEPRVYAHDEATRDFGYSPRNFGEGITDEVKEYLNK